MSLQHYLEIVTKEKKAEGLWSDGKPEGMEKDTSKKVNVKDLPDDVQHNIRFMGATKIINQIKKNPQAEPLLKQHRFILYDGNIYAAPAKNFIHDYILSWMMLNAGLKIKKREYEIWHKIPMTKFFCLQQYPMDVKYVGFSESYTDESIKELKKYEDEIRAGINKIYPKMIFVHAKISNYWKFDKLIGGTTDNSNSKKTDFSNPER